MAAYHPLESQRLKWVLVNDQLCNVSEFTPLSPKDRPKTLCPLCERPVTLKLGSKRSHHFAHRPEDVCAATNPESAIHLNSKFHIYWRLLTAKQVYVSSSCQHCSRTKRVLWKCDWDRVEVEYRLDSLRPDISLLKDEKVIGAIEVFVTHSVDPEKAVALQKLDIDWIEIHGSEEVYTEPDAWTPEDAFHPNQQHPPPSKWLCADCKKAEEQEQYKRDHPIVTMFAKMVDFYYPTGKKFRDIYYVKYAIEFGEVRRIWVENKDRRVIAVERAPISPESKARLNQTFKKSIVAISEKVPETIVDSPMEWTDWVDGKKFVAKDLDRFPFRYGWDIKQRKWLRDTSVDWIKLN